MRRVLPLLLVPALIATSGTGSSLHTHAYADHDHPEHHHGPAAHEHHLAAAHRDDGVTRVEGCDPARHTVPVAFLCAAVPQGTAVVAEFRVPALPTIDLRRCQQAGCLDVRVHGPPPRSQASPRAPPLTPHA